MDLKELNQAVDLVTKHLRNPTEEYTRGIARWQVDQLDKLFERRLVDELDIVMIQDTSEASPWDYPFTFVFRDKGFRFINVYNSGATLVCDTSLDEAGVKGRSAATAQQLAESIAELLPIAVNPKPIQGRLCPVSEIRSWAPLAPEDLVRELYG
jgi:hypothetical protein